MAVLDLHRRSYSRHSRQLVFTLAEEIAGNHQGVQFTSRIESLREAVEDEAVKGSNAGVRTSGATAVAKKPRITIEVNEMTSSIDLEAGKGGK